MDGDNERSRIMGEYYRDLSLNYSNYLETRMWPDPPFTPLSQQTIEYLPD